MQLFDCILGYSCSLWLWLEKSTEKGNVGGLEQFLIGSIWYWSWLAASETRIHGRSHVNSDAGLAAVQDDTLRDSSPATSETIFYMSMESPKERIDESVIQARRGQKLGRRSVLTCQEMARR